MSDCNMPEFEQLVGAALDGQITDDQQTRLLDLLASSTSGLDAYLRLVFVAAFARETCADQSLGGSSMARSDHVLSGAA